MTITDIMQKRDSNISLTAPSEIKQKLLGLAHISDKTLSDYALIILVEHVEKIEREARLINEALGINVNKI